MNQSLDMQCKFYYYTTGLGCSVYSKEGEWLEGFGLPETQNPLLEFQLKLISFPLPAHTVKILDLKNGCSVLLAVHNDLHYISAPFILGDHSMEQLQRITEKNHIPPHDQLAFSTNLRSMTAMTSTRSFFLLTFLQNLPKLTIKDFDAIASRQAETVPFPLAIDQVNPEDFPYHNLQRETLIMDAIKSGNLTLVESIYRSNVQQQRFTKLGPSVLRSLKNNAIVFSTLCARAAIRGGVSSEASLSLADEQIVKIESIYEIERLITLNLDYALRFTSLVRAAWNDGDRMKERVQLYVNQHMNEKITSKEIAPLFHLTPAYFSRKFHNSTGITLPGWVEKIRIDSAIHLLKFTRIPLVEVAIQCGFSSQSHFAQRMRAATGKTPQSYRR